MNKSTCRICGRQLTNETSVDLAIGPVCRAKKLKEAEQADRNQRPLYSVEFIEDYDICLIHETYDPDEPRISLTNSIEFVINDIVKQHGVCTNRYTFIQHSTGRRNPTFFCKDEFYHEYDLVIVDEARIRWRYLWHNENEQEQAEFSNDLLVERVAKIKLDLQLDQIKNQK